MDSLGDLVVIAPARRARDPDSSPGPGENCFSYIIDIRNLPIGAKTWYFLVLTYQKVILKLKFHQNQCKAIFHGSMDIRVCCHSVYGSTGCDNKSFTLVCRWHQLLPGSLPNGRLPRVTCRLGRELFTLPSHSSEEAPGLWWPQFRVVFVFIFVFL